MLNDLRFAVRLLWKSPGFAAAAVIALALGIGANTAIFSVVNSVLLRPLPFRDGAHLAIFWEMDPSQGFNRQGPSGPNYLTFRDQNKSFADMALLEQGTGTVTGFGEPQQIPALRVTRSFLPVLGFTPILGRNFAPSEGWNQRVVIIGYGAWERYFGKDPSVLGKRMILDDIPYTVIGVLPASFWFPDPGELIAPFGDSDLAARNRYDHNFGVFGHLKPGVTMPQANAELNGIEHRIGEQFNGLKGWATTVVPLADVVAENSRSAMLLLLAAVGLVLLIACANLANLMLSRAAGRGRESAIRMALGAGRWRVARQFLMESAVLGSIGGVLGLILAMWGVDLLEGIVPQTMPLSGGAGNVVRPQIHADAWALLFTLATSVATGLIFGLAPAIAASRAKVHDALKEGGRGSSAGGNRLRNAFAVSEVALALVLLIGAALVMKSFWRMQQVNPGFAAEHVLAMEMELPTDSKYRTRPEQAEFFRRVLDNVRSMALVRSAGVTNQLPLDTSDEPRVEFTIDGRAPLPSGQSYLADYRDASPDYFRAMGIPLRKGRVFTDQDKADRPLVAIINETLARRYWADGLNPIGQHLRFNARMAPEIVGIVGDVKDSALNRDSAPAVYTSYLQFPEAKMSLVVRAEGDPTGMIRAVKTQVWAVDKDQPMYKIRTMEQAIAESQSSTRFTLSLLGIFAAVALVLAAVGIYGVISYAVTQRTREIGIRIALGADRSDVLRLVVGQGTGLALAGVALGVAGAFALTRIMANLLYGVSATDPLIFVGASAFLGFVALAASYIPGRRATRVDPTVSLRYE
jgi:putative ABC transport system permease protein